MTGEGSLSSWQTDENGASKLERNKLTEILGKNNEKSVLDSYP